MGKDSAPVVGEGFAPDACAVPEPEEPVTVTTVTAIPSVISVEVDRDGDGAGVTEEEGDKAPEDPPANADSSAKPI